MEQLILALAVFVIIAVVVFTTKLMRTNRALAADIVATDRLLDMISRSNTGYLETVGSMQRDHDYLVNRNRMLTAQVNDQVAVTNVLRRTANEQAITIANLEAAAMLLNDELEQEVIARAKAELGGTIILGSN